eukprot:GHVU01097581.1.p1 GENE.GHVU01097581.1~~GHVU01097581.1.p1  ORF type:complete len:309 (-),score=15.63 GHVU01097581.1:551-1477(-)
MCVCVSIVCTSIAQQQHVTPLTMFEKLRAGGYAGVTAQFLIYPLEVVKTRLAVAAPRTYAGGWDCLSGTYRREGLAALYRGLAPSIIGIIPYAAIDLSCFETLKRAYLRWHNYSDDHHPPVFVLLGCGALSSALGQVVSYPLGTLRLCGSSSRCQRCSADPPTPSAHVLITLSLLYMMHTHLSVCLPACLSACICFRFCSSSSFLRLRPPRGRQRSSVRGCKQTECQAAPASIVLLGRRSCAPSPRGARGPSTAESARTSLNRFRPQLLAGRCTRRVCPVGETMFSDSEAAGVTLQSSLEIALPRVQS